MEKKPNITTRMIAKETGLSQSTVSMILSGRPGMKFAPETVEKVLNTANYLGYHYKGKPKQKENRIANTILIMCPSLFTQYYTTLIQAITEAAEAEHLHTLTACTMRSLEMEEYYLQLAAQSGFYGVIYIYPPKAIDLINQLSKKHGYVMVSDYNPNLRISLIELDSKKSGKIIGKHLIDLGHRHIAFLTTPLSNSELPRLRRLEGLREAFSDAGLDSAQVKVYALTEEQWNHDMLGNRYYDAGYQLALSYLKQPGNITAFVGTNDQVAIGIIDALYKQGYSVPKDYSVCGFDNTLSSSFSGISLTTIDHRMDEKGKDAVSMLINQRKWLTMETQDKRPPVMRLEYEPQLLVRSSTECPLSLR